MICCKCGATIPDGTKFCSVCGAAQENISNANAQGTTASSGNSTIDAEKVMREASNKLANWREYATPENCEKIAVASIFVPIILVILYSVIFELLYSLLSWIPGFYFVLYKIIGTILKIAVTAASAFSVYVTFDYMSKNPSKKTKWGYITWAMGIVGLFVCIIYLFMLYKLYALRSALSFVCFVMGLDAFSRVILQKKGFEEDADVAKDFTYLFDGIKGFFNKSTSKQ